jgi:large subunit ribosomal protein L15e
MTDIDYTEKVRKWNKENVVERLARPTNTKRARSLGYKAKQGFVVARIRIKKGGRRKPSTRKARKPKSSGVFFTPESNKQAIAERRVSRKFPNLEVLNSYYAGEDGKSKYFEVIMIDKNHPAIIKDKERNWILGQRRRVFRGLTSSGKRARGLRR